MATMEQDFVTEAQLRAIAAKALASHVGPLTRHAALVRLDPTYDPEKEAKDDRVMALAFDMLVTFGPDRYPTFEADCPVRRHLRTIGEVDETIDAVASVYGPARAAAQHDARGGARRYLSEEKLPDDPTNRAMAYGVLVRARAEALRQRAARRFGTQSPAPAPTPAPTPTVPSEQFTSLADAIGNLRNTVEGMRSAAADREADVPKGRPCPIDALNDQIDAYVRTKLDSGRWRTKKRGAVAEEATEGEAAQALRSTGREGAAKSLAEPARNHARATLEVFVDFLRMRDIGFAHEVDQALVADFMRLLNELPTHYRRSSALRALPLADLIERTKYDLKVKRGLDPKTTRRHIGDLDQFWTYLRGQGRAVQPIDFAAVKPPKPRELPSDEAPKWQEAQLKRFLRTPIFIGCAAIDCRGEPGSTLVRDGTFFVPLLALLMGLRREEAAGLEASAIGFEGRIPVLRIRENVVRGIKTLKSSRTIPIHRELVRLGLLRLASRRRKAKELLLFPELVGAPSAAMGDRVYDTLADALGPVSLEEGSSLIPRPVHGLRHWCNAAMKDGEVPSEVRDDILGKRGMKETEDRYSRMATLERMRSSMQVAECLTSHIPSWCNDKTKWSAK